MLRILDSLRRQLLVGILVPVVLLLAFNGVTLYQQALAAANRAYDRTLLASAKTIGEQLDVRGFDGEAQIRATVPYSALEAFEADNRSQMIYRVSNLWGERVSGYADLPFWRGQLPLRPPYAALVDFYDDHYLGKPVRVAVLLQPVSSDQGRGMAVVQVAETLELRETLAREILVDTLWQQLLLVAVIGLVVAGVVQHATAPVRRVSGQLQARREGELTPLVADDAPRELQPLVDATNAVMARLDHLLEHQKRFVRDTAHQLRTPLAVLRVQLQSALRGDVDAASALHEISDTVERATVLANQMLSLAKVEQLRQQPVATVHDFSALVREVALELSPLVADKDLDFEIETRPAPVRAHEWMLRELARNLMHNAIRHTPHGGSLTVQVELARDRCTLTVADSGPGISAELQARLFQPFSSGDIRSGSGLGLAICHEIAQALGGSIALDNRAGGGSIRGLAATVRLPLAENPGYFIAPMERLRIDKWLWAARFYKTRTLAAEEIGKGRVEVNGQPVKAAREVKPGDTVSVRREAVTRTVVVRGVSATRGPAPVAQLLYEETADSIAQREQAAQARRLAPEPSLSIEQGRPTKRNRRELDQARGGWGDRWSASLDD